MADTTLESTSKAATAAGRDVVNKFDHILTTVIEYLTLKGFKLLGALIIVIIGLFLARWIGKLLKGWLDTKHIEPPIKVLLVKFTKLLCFAFTFLIALGTLEINIMPLIAGLGVAGLGVGLAMQGVLSNLVAGFTIIFTKPYRVGEYVALHGVEGQVEAIELFTTILSHPDRSRIVIPNRKVVGEILHNYGTIRQLDLLVGVAYSTDLNKATSLISEVLRSNPQILQDPAPVIGVANLGDSSINLRIRPWTTVKEFGNVRNFVYQQVVQKFSGADIQIPFPQREIRVLNEPERTDEESKILSPLVKS